MTSIDHSNIKVYTRMDELLLPAVRLLCILAKRLSTFFSPPELPPMPQGIHISERAWRRNAAAIMAIHKPES